MKMTEKELIKQLNSLKAIVPDSNYARKSRLLILSHGEIVSPRRRAIVQSFSFAGSMALVAVFLFVLTLGGIGGPLKSLFLPSLPGIDNESLLTEADNITQDIDIRLREINYFANENTVALANSNNQTGTFDFASDEAEIDQLLDEVIDY